jgi:hypothetical protein
VFHALPSRESVALDPPPFMSARSATELSRRLTPTGHLGVGGRGRRRRGAIGDHRRAGLVQAGCPEANLDVRPTIGQTSDLARTLVQWDEFGDN